jgi:hypothetical protein
VYLSAYIAFSDEKYSNNAAIIKLLKLPVLYIIAWGLVQILVSPDFSLYNSVWHKEVRVSSCLREPQTAGIAIAMLFMLSWNYLLSTKNNTMVVICLLLFGIGCFTGTKTFFLGTGAAMVMSVFWVRHKSKLLIAVCMLTILAIICFNYWIDFPIFERLFEMEQSLNFRQEVYWAYAVEIFNDNWLTGIGPGNFQDYVESAKIPLTHFVEGEYVYASQPESGYLLWLDELGIMAVVWLLMIVYVCTRRGNHIINISLLIPWMVGFVSVYNFISMHIVFLAFLVAAIMVKSNNFKES